MKRKNEESILYIGLKEYLNMKKDRYGKLSREDLDFILSVLFHCKKERRNLLIAELIQMEWLEVIKVGQGNSYCYKVLK